ncbi:GIY-YIG nuclease family protein [Seonamhaeicola maritimus]|uniref:GIY-YIG nuclease family protein n=1 Tax=Seonamhaeicola maritimus TaxID=2591822 RepID=UPI00249437F6|nr:GIY-YIG nuclease family protein [Seonamhaeicola maritimus]
MMTNNIEAYNYVYVLFSLKDGKKYTGYTKDLSSRFEAHQKGKVKSTKHRRPFKLVYFEGCLSQEDALKREKYLKTHYGKMYLGKRLKSYFIGQVENKECM